MTAISNIAHRRSREAHPVPNRPQLTGNPQQFAQLGSHSTHRGVECSRFKVNSGAPMPNWFPSRCVALPRLTDSGWNIDKKEDHAVLQKLHDTYLAAIDEWQAQRPRWRNVVKALNVTVGTRDARNIRLYHQCSHFSACYSLNHLLALVVDRFISETTGQHTITGNVSVVSVEPTIVSGAPTHRCGLDCWRTTPHEVRAQTNVTCLSGPGSAFTVQVFGGIVIRHGLKQHTKAALRRHILPMHLI